MKISILVAAMSATVLTACASNVLDARTIDPENPGVFVVDNKYIVVDQEPIYFSKGKRDLRITWQLPPDSKYRFPKDGIVIKDPGDEFPDCHPEQNGLRFSCMNKHYKSGTYKYTIKVEGPSAVPPLDPIVIND